MTPGRCDAVPLPVKFTIAPRKFSHQMLPLVGHLPVSDAQLANRTDATDLPAIKGVATPRRLGMDRGEIGVDGGAGRWVSAKPFELWMMAIALRAPAQHRLRKQCLAPQRNQALRIEISRMDGPESQTRDS